MEIDGVKTVELRPGFYSIDGVPTILKTTERIPFSDSIRVITETKQKSCYINLNEDQLSIDEYDNTIKVLTQDAEYYDYEYHFSDLDKEYAYKKFVKAWNPVYKFIQVLSDPLIFGEVYSITTDTGSPYITAMFLTGNPKSDLYELNLEAGVFAAVRQKFDDLGFMYEPDLSYEQTKFKKIWSAGKRSDLEFLTAFGTYLFTSNKLPYKIYRGKLEACQTTLNRYVEEYLNKIDSYYNVNYNKRNSDNAIEILLHSKIKSIKSALKDVPTNSKTSSKIGYCISTASEIESLFNELFKPYIK